MNLTTQLDHQEGFERERRFHVILAQALRDCPTIQARTVKRIISHVAPDFLDGLFEARPCRRKLRYVGCGCEDAVCPHGDEFFRMGGEYESTDFTGATYSISGYGERRIGFHCFERLT